MQASGFHRSYELPGHVRLSRMIADIAKVLATMNGYAYARSRTWEATKGGARGLRKTEGTGES